MKNFEGTIWQVAFFGLKLALKYDGGWNEGGLLCPPMRLQFISLCHTEQDSDANTLASMRFDKCHPYLLPRRQYIENQ